MTETHCMIDIETLGTEPGTIPVSVGAVTFTATDSEPIDEELYIEIDPEDCQTRGLNADISTIIWWMQTNAEEAGDVIPGGQQLHNALHQLTKWFDRYGVDTVWAKSPIFDIAILEHCYEECGMEPPWRFYQMRDVRTLQNRDHAVGETHSDDQTKHNALDDAKVQATAVAQTLEILDE